MKSTRKHSRRSTTVGQKLLEIKAGRLYEDEGFKTWSAYCSSGRIDYRKAQADNYIRASELRPKLPETPTNCSSWTESQLRELCRCETDVDAKRVARKAISQAKKTGDRVTAKMIAKIRDGDDETGASREETAGCQAAGFIARNPPCANCPTLSWTGERRWSKLILSNGSACRGIFRFASNVKRKRYPVL